MQTKKIGFIRNMALSAAKWLRFHGLTFFELYKQPLFSAGLIPWLAGNNQKDK